MFLKKFQVDCYIETYKFGDNEKGKKIFDI